MTSRGHALASIMLRHEAEHAALDIRELDRLHRLADRAEKDAGMLTFGEALCWVQASHVESEPLPLYREEYVPPRPLGAGRRAA